MTKDMEKKTLRKYANHWEWFNKPRKELGVVEDWLASMHLVGERTYTTPRLGPHPDQAPDCVVLNENGKNIAVELRELVCKKAVEKINEIMRSTEIGALKNF